MMNKWIDLSVTLDNSFLVYPGDDPIGFTAVKAIERDEYNLQKMTTSMHVGTHMDAMKHVLVEHEIQVIGFDLPSPEYVNGHFLNMHRDLMNHGIYIIENLTNLEQLDDVVDFIGLPLKISGMDGSMIRAVAKNIG